MNRLALIGLGAGLMYLLDPDQGKRRRALIRDQTVRGVNRADLALGKARRDVGNRSRGLLAEARQRFTKENDVPDEVLTERVRAKIGRIVSHPHSIQVTADHGHIVVSGPILTREAQRLNRGLSSVRGVNTVENRLDLHQTPGDVPGLQGEPGPRLEVPDLMQENWSPATRLAAATAGSALAVAGTMRRGVVGMAMGSAGLGLLACALKNIGLGSLMNDDDGLQSSTAGTRPMGDFSDS